DLYSLTIARWLTTLPEQRATAENYTIPRDVTCGLFIGISIVLQAESRTA
ncbi:hypothetical protein B0G38_002535, partial [Arthrobacter sp. VKM Ac-2550]|nr:hypothetical protein [Arthrobacter sp. VKM Ac-2550]